MLPLREVAMRVCATTVPRWMVDERRVTMRIHPVHLVQHHRYPFNDRRNAQSRAALTFGSERVCRERRGGDTPVEWRVDGLVQSAKYASLGMDGSVIARQECVGAPDAATGGRGPPSRRRAGWCFPGLQLRQACG